MIRKESILDYPEPKKQGPLLFSREAVFFFGFLFTALAGGIMLIENLKTVNKREAITPVLIFCIIFTLGSVAIGFLFPYGKSYGFLLLHFFGAVMLSNVFWNKHLFYVKKYRKRPIRYPLIFCLVLSSAFIYWYIYDLLHP
jgi:hypothetical protein